MLTTAELRKLRRRLPKGFQRMAHDRMAGKYTVSYIGYVANGQRQSPEVLLALIAVAEEHERQVKAIKDRLNAKTA